MKQVHRFSLSVQYADTSADLPSRQQFRRWVRNSVLQELQCTIRIVDGEEGRMLNRDYRGKDYATNVLTFVYDDMQPLAGDLVFCAPVVAREALEQGKNLLSHYAHLTVHGMLHLQGYDHETDAEAEEMEALESALIVKMGYPPPYEVTRKA